MISVIAWSIVILAIFVPLAIIGYLAFQLSWWLLLLAPVHAYVLYKIGSYLSQHSPQPYKEDILGTNEHIVAIIDNGRKKTSI